jgi:hypothetical protein
MRNKADSAATDAGQRASTFSVAMGGLDRVSVNLQKTHFLMDGRVESGPDGLGAHGGFVLLCHVRLIVIGFALNPV